VVGLALALRRVSPIETLLTRHSANYKPYGDVAGRSRLSIPTRQMANAPESSNETGTKKIAAEKLISTAI